MSQGTVLVKLVGLVGFREFSDRHTTQHNHHIAVKTMPLYAFPCVAVNPLYQGQYVNKQNCNQIDRMQTNILLTLHYNFPTLQTNLDEHSEVFMSKSCVVALLACLLPHGQDYRHFQAVVWPFDSGKRFGTLMKMTMTVNVDITKF